MVGTLFQYERAVDCTMLTALGSIVVQQASPNQNTVVKVKKFLDYAATQPNEIVAYNTSDMVLAGHSDASYLFETKARSRAGKFFHVKQLRRSPQ